MNKKQVVILALAISLLSIVAFAGFASAGTAGSLTNVDTQTAPGGAGVSQDTFSLGSTVYIYWGASSPVGGTVDVTVYDPAGAQLVQWLNQAPGASGTLSFVVNQPGYYDIAYNGTRLLTSRTIASVSIFVLPESALGTLIALAAGLAAVGTFKIVKGKSKTKQ
jgi:hypothetical protein